MRILLDECVPARLRKIFPSHAVQTVTETGWRTAKDGPLLTFAEQRFDAFITVDRKLERQVEVSGLRLGIVVARVLNNRLDGFESIFTELNAAVDKISPGQTIQVVSPALKI